MRSCLLVLLCPLFTSSRWYHCGVLPSGQQSVLKVPSCVPIHVSIVRLLFLCYSDAAVLLMPVLQLMLLF